MTTWIDRKFGTWRGLIRASLAHAEHAAGRIDAFRLHRPESVQRVVFVCMGNICRSAYAHAIALECGMNVASLGLSTTTGVSSPEEAVGAAQRQGIDMQAHQAVNWGDFKVQPGDAFFVMEIRQAHELRRRLGNRQDVQVCLLGMWCAPLMPHLHDPFTLSAEYFDTCFVRVEDAVRRLSAALPHVRQNSQQQQA